MPSELTLLLLAVLRLSAVRWGVAGNIVIAWILTLPLSGLTGALAWLVLSPIL